MQSCSMRLIIIVITFTFSCYANDTDRALKHCQKAILAYPKVKKMTKTATNKIKRYIPKNKAVTTIGAVGFQAATQGRISTTQIKNMKIKFLDADVRPDIIYNFRENNIETTVRVDWRW